jgi:hypothetical protein
MSAESYNDDPDLLPAAVAWHKSGRLTAARSGSVAFTQSIIDEVLHARALLQPITRVADVTIIVTERYLADVEQFLTNTAALEQFRRG